MAVQIPDKTYFKIGEVSRILGVEPYNIRYWESQFKVVKPAKTKSRQRLYRRRDIEVLQRIKKLLYEEGYTIAGAKKRLKSILERGEGDTAAETETDTVMSTAERLAYDGLLTSCQGELLEARAEVATLKQELTNQRHEHAAQIDLLQADRDALLEKLEAADLHVVALERQLEEANERSAGVAGMSDLERDALQTKISALEAEHQRLQAELKTAMQAVADASTLKVRLSAQVDRSAQLEKDLERVQERSKRLSESVRGQLRPLLDVVDRE